MRRLTGAPRGALRGALPGLLLAGVLLLAGACSAQPETAKGSAQPAQAVQAFLRALGNKDADAACGQLSTGGQPLADSGLAQCTEGLTKVIDAISDPAEFDQLRTATVSDATVDGDKATVSAAKIANVPAAYQEDIDLVRIGGRWFIDSKQ